MPFRCIIDCYGWHYEVVVEKIDEIGIYSRKFMFLSDTGLKPYKGKFGGLFEWAACTEIKFVREPFLWE